MDGKDNMMKKVNVEIKARCKDMERIRKVLQAEDARFEGTDRQVDTYFNTSNGRLKLREGKIENHLISYSRKNQSEPKLSDITLYDTSKDSEVLKEMLIKHFGIKCVVNKKRGIYHIRNIKIHLDSVEKLGLFLEIEAIADDKNDEDKLKKQVEYYIRRFGIKKNDLIKESYSDMVLKNEL